MNHNTQEFERIVADPGGQQLPRQLDRSLRAILRRERARRRRPRIKRVLVRAAAMFAIVLAVSFGALYTAVEAFRLDPFGWIMEWLGDHGAQRINYSADYLISRGITYLPQWLPRGYEITGTPCLQNIQRITWGTTDEALIMLEITRDNGATDFDIEKDSAEAVTINGQQGFLSSHRGTAFLVWSYDGYAFTLHCPDDVDAVRIAESVRPI